MVDVNEAPDNALYCLRQKDIYVVMLPLSFFFLCLSISRWKASANYFAFCRAHPLSLHSRRFLRELLLRQFAFTTTDLRHRRRNIFQVPANALTHA